MSGDKFFFHGLVVVLNRENVHYVKVVFLCLLLATGQSDALCLTNASEQAS